MFSLEDAIILATDAHRGQVDKVGEPYILHPLRVMFSFPTYQWRQRMVGILHDVIEDTNLTAEGLHNAGVPAELVASVCALSYTDTDKQSGMSYANFIRDKVCRNDIAREVKIADIKDNTSMERLIRLDRDTQDRLLTKYNRALEILERRQ